MGNSKSPGVERAPESRNYRTRGILCVGGVCIAGLLALMSERGLRCECYSSENERQKTRVVCERIKGKYDEDHNGYHSSAEGMKMARALGYEKVIPTENVIFALKPWVDTDAELTIYNPEKSWTDSMYVSKSKLEEVAAGSPLVEKAQ